MRRLGFIPAGVGCVLSAFLVGGCVTTGGSDPFANAVANNRRIAQQLDSDLGGALSQLSETASDLSKRVDATDQEVRQLREGVEESQRKLERIESQVASLTQNLYRHFGLSSGPAPAAMPPPNIMPSPEDILVEPPRESRSVGSSIPSSETLMGLEPEPGPASPVAAYQEAQRSFKNKDYETALKQFDSYLQRFPNSEFASYAQFWKAGCYYRLADQNRDRALFQQSAAEYEKYRANYPTSKYIPDAIHNQAGAYLQLGDSARALRLLQELIAAYPNSEAAARARAKLEELQGTRQ